MSKEDRKWFLVWAEIEARQKCEAMLYNGENELAVIYATHAAVAKTMREEMGDE